MADRPRATSPTYAYIDTKSASPTFLQNSLSLQAGCHFVAVTVCVCSAMQVLYKGAEQWNEVEPQFATRSARSQEQRSFLHQSSESGSERLESPLFQNELLFTKGAGNRDRI